MSNCVSTTTKIIFTISLFFILFLVKDLIGHILMAFVFASAVKPIVDTFEDKKVPRALSGAFILFLILSFFSLIIFLIFPPLISEIQNFISSFPGYWQEFLEWLPQFEENIENSPFKENIRNAIEKSMDEASKGITSFVGFALNTFGQVFNLLFIGIVSFYLVIEKDIAGRFSEFVFGKNNKNNGNQADNKFLKCWKIAEKKAGRWLQGYIILSVIVSVLVYIGLSILGVKYALLLAFLAGILEIIPFLGPVVAGLIGFILTFFQAGFGLAIWVAIIFLIVQQLENYLIVPSIMKNRVDLNPLLTIIILSVAGRIAGVYGMILSVPMTATAISIWKEIKEEQC